MSVQYGNSKNTNSLHKLVVISILTAIVLILQMIRIPLGAFSLTLVLIPIVIGGALCGVKAGAWLGFVFGVAVLISGDAALFLPWGAFETVVVVLLKGTCAGFVSALVYRALHKQNKYVAVCVSSVVAPVVNTGLFLCGSLLFFHDDISVMANGGNVLQYILVVFIGLNFFIELGANIVLAPTMLRIINIKNN